MDKPTDECVTFCWATLIRILQATGEVGCLSVAYRAMTVDVVVDGSVLGKEEEEEIFRFLLDAFGMGTDR